MIKIEGAKNKNADPKHFSLMLVGLNKDNAVIWALSAEPMMATIQGKATESISSNVFVIPGILKFKAKVFFILALI